ncbi:MAG TPA: PilZ domain-containing protein [Terriglobia bacterium]|nr:PilZ domain-containing protein [Terriglobia bacterium]
MADEGREYITPEIDKRRQRRAQLITEVKCEALNRDEFLVTRDVSAGGLFVSTKNPLPLKSEVRVAFSLATGSAAISCRGRVVYSMQGLGMGIQFADLSEDGRSALEKFVDEAN